MGGSRGREAGEWIEKVKPIYAEDADWSLSVEAFEKGKKDSTENNLNFTHRFEGLWGTMIETCGREKAAVIPHAYQDEPELVARAITLIEKEMMEKIFNERLRDKKTGTITVYAEFQEEIMKYEQRKRAVSAMLGPASAPTPPPARAPAAAGGGRGLGGRVGGGRGDRGRGAVRQLATGRGRGGRGGGGQGATPPAAQDGTRTPGQGADGLPRYVKDAMPHPLWKSAPYSSCRMPPMLQQWKVPMCPEILRDELPTVRQAVADMHVQRARPRAEPRGATRNSRQWPSL